MPRCWLMLFALVLPAGCAEQQSAAPQSDASSAAAAPSATAGRKIAYRADVRLVVEHFDDVPAKVDALAVRFEGFIAQTSQTGSVRDQRHGNWTLRVPAARYASFLQALAELGEITSLESTSEDKTTEWVDLDARLRNTRIEEQRLLALLGDATGKLDEILAVEKELARVRGEIEQMQSRQRLLDDLVSLATVTLRVDEIKDYFPEQSAGYLTRARRALEMSLTSLAALLADLSLILIAALPWLATLLAPLAILIGLIRVYQRRRRVPAQVVAQ